MSNLKISISKEDVDRRLVPFYVTFYPNLTEKVDVRIDEHFSEIVYTELKLFLEGKSPPDEIATTIQNMADDFLSGSEIAIKLGDYLAINKYMRKRSQ